MLAASRRSERRDARPTTQTRPLDDIPVQLESGLAKMGANMDCERNIPSDREDFAMSEIPPELVDHPQYEVLRELGRGGMGVVYLARNRLMDRSEVLKVVGKELLDRPGAADRFLREIQSAARLTHPNVVGAYNALQVGSLLVFAMEYVQGNDLAAIVKTSGPLPIRTAVHYVRQVAMGLQHAYERGLVHRDIKPSNLILVREGEKGQKHTIKILDFGLAKASSEKEDSTELTGAGRALGTPDYMAPEQILDAASAKTAADIYSLGGTFYYLLTGYQPFRGATSLVELFDAHRFKEPHPLTDRRPEVPPELAAIVSKMMAKNPANRYQQPAEIVQALTPFLSTGNTMSKAIVAPTPGTPPVPTHVPAVVPTAVATAIPAASQSQVSYVRAAVPMSEQSASMAVAVSPFAGATDGQADDTPVATRSPKRKSKPQPDQNSGKRMGLIAGTVGAVFVTLGLALWASGVFSSKATAATGEIVFRNLPRDADIEINGQKGLIIRNGNGSVVYAEIRPEPHQVRVLRGGVELLSESVQLTPTGGLVRLDVPSQTVVVRPPATKISPPPPTNPTPATTATTPLPQPTAINTADWEQVRQIPGLTLKMPRFVATRNSGYFGSMIRGLKIASNKSSANGADFIACSADLNDTEWWFDISPLSILETYKLADMVGAPSTQQIAGRTWAVGKYLPRNKPQVIMVWATRVGRWAYMLSIEVPLDRENQLDALQKPFLDSVQITANPNDSAIVPPPKSATPFALGQFQPLFNGKDLAGWDLPKEGKNWSVANELLIGSTNAQEIATLTYQANIPDHFHLRAELVGEASGDAGVLFKWKLRGKFSTGLFMSLTTNGPGWVFRGVPNPAKEGRIAMFSIEGNGPVAPPRQPTANTDGVTTLELISVGRSITTKLNGRVVKEVDNNKPTYPDGGIALYCSGAANIKIQSLVLKELTNLGEPPANPKPARSE